MAMMKPHYEIKINTAHGLVRVAGNPTRRSRESERTKAFSL